MQFEAKYSLFFLFFVIRNTVKYELPQRRIKHPLSTRIISREKRNFFSFSLALTLKLRQAPNISSLASCYTRWKFTFWICPLLISCGVNSKRQKWQKQGRPFLSKRIYSSIYGFSSIVTRESGYSEKKNKQIKNNVIWAWKRRLIKEFSAGGWMLSRGRGNPKLSVPSFVG